jgi:hypothetical protein
MTRHLCSRCGQPLPDIRLGVRLTPLKARIFDLIQRGGEDGIAVDDLFNIVFPDGSVKRDTLKSHVWQINDAIEDSGYRIKGNGAVGGAYRLVKVMVTESRSGTGRYR